MTRLEDGEALKNGDHFLFFPEGDLEGEDAVKRGPPSKPVVALDGAPITPWERARDGRVWALHKPGNMEVTLAKRPHALVGGPPLPAPALPANEGRRRCFGSWLSALPRTDPLEQIVAVGQFFFSKDSC